MKFLTVVGALTSLSSIVAAKEICLLPVDVVILQDTTGSFVEDLPNVTRILPKLVDDILIQNPGSKFAVTDFKDKPYRDLGDPSDHCYQLWSPLSSDKDVFCKAFGQLYASGGGDKPEAQLQALINVVQDKAVGWRQLTDKYRYTRDMYDLSSETGARLIIMSTDATPHDPKDYEFYNGSMDDDFTEEPRPPKSMPDYPRDPSAVTPDTQCRVHDYPNMELAAKIVKENNVNVVMLIPNNETEALEKWRKFNTMLGQPSSFVQYISADSSDAASVILKAMSEVSDYVCNLESSTTPAPNTTPAPTTTSTPVPTTTTTPATTATTTPVPTTTTTPATTATTTPATTATTTPATTATTTPAPTTPVPTTTTTPATTTTTTTTTPATTTTTTTPVPATTTTPATATSRAPEPSLDTAGSQQTTSTTKPPTCPDCPVCHHGPCPPCECPEVVIKLRHRPSSLHFKIENEHE